MDPSAAVAETSQSSGLCLYSSMAALWGSFWKTGTKRTPMSFNFPHTKWCSRTSEALLTTSEIHFLKTLKTSFLFLLDDSEYSKKM